MAVGDSRVICPGGINANHGIMSVENPADGINKPPPSTDRKRRHDNICHHRIRPKLDSSDDDKRTVFQLRGFSTLNRITNFHK